MIVAAEASSSLYAQRLLEMWKQEGQEIHAFGIGSREMENLGFEILGRSEELAVVGLQEVMAHFPLIRKTFKSLLYEAQKRRPAFVLLLDYPDFNLRLASELKKLNIKVIYYISPQVWAWRTGRVKKIKKIIEHMLVIFPFENEFYQKNKVQSDFVGHPLLDELPRSQFSVSERNEFRARHGVLENEKVLGLMPGSRKSEIKHHLHAQLEAARLLYSRHPELRVFLLVAPTLERELFAEALQDCEFPVQLIKDEPNRMIQLTDFILCASGTATLMVGLMEKPMVIMYRMNAVTAFIAKRLVTQTPFFGMVNLIMGERVVPELFQEQANPQMMALELEKYLVDESYLKTVTENLKKLKDRLGRAGATKNVAAILQKYIDEPFK
jgi:lipid-A-disaccharide synthase